MTAGGAAVRDMAQDALDQRAEIGRAGQVGAVAGDVDAGQDDLVMTLVDEARDPVDHRARGDRAAVAAAVGDDAKGAAMIAAVLHFDEGARVFGEGVRELRCVCARR